MARGKVQRLSPEQAGTALLTYVFSFHSHGRARQVVIMQIAFDVVATLLFVLLFYIEVLLEVPAVLALAQAVSDNPGTQAVALALFFQAGGALLLVLLRNRVVDFIEQRFPPSEAEVLSELEYLYDKAADSPETAMILASKEQTRLLRRLPAYLAYVRDPELRSTRAPADYHDAFLAVSQEVGKTLAQVSGKSMNRADSDELIRITKTQEQLASLESLIYQLSCHLLDDKASEKARELGLSIMESLDFIVMTAIDATESADEDDLHMLDSLTQDRSAMMTKIRHSYFDEEQNLSRDDRNFVMDISILLENAVQTLNRYVQLLGARS